MSIPTKMLLCGSRVDAFVKQFVDRSIVDLRSTMELIPSES
jgi:hypothetical protein